MLAKQAPVKESSTHRHIIYSNLVNSSEIPNPAYGVCLIWIGNAGIVFIANICKILQIKKATLYVTK